MGIIQPPNTKEIEKIMIKKNSSPSSGPGPFLLNAWTKRKEKVRAINKEKINVIIVIRLTFF